jgi:hypothetical protein
MSETLAPAQQRGRDYTHSLQTPAVWLASLFLVACGTAPVDQSPPPPAPEPVVAPVSAPVTPPPQAPRPAPSFTPAPRAPATHTVVKGDTLWDISAMFLRDPWKWREIWQVNPQIQNPDLIYPGDVITLTYDADGRAMLSASRDGETFMTSGGATPGDGSYTTSVGSGPSGGSTVKVTPRIRTVPLAEAIPTVPTEAIRPFLSRNTVVGEDELETAPYVMGPVDGRLLTGSGDRIYVRGIQTDAVARFTIVRPGEAYEDPDTGALLGYEALFVGEAVMERFGDPGVARIEGARREVMKGDRLLVGVSGGVSEVVTPRGAREGLSGTIIAVVDGVEQIGQYAVVVINRGGREGVNPGDVFTVMQARGDARDETRQSGLARKMLGLKGRSVELPEERAGEVMVFRAYDAVSLALVMRASSEMHIGDLVRAP